MKNIFTLALLFMGVVSINAQKADTTNPLLTDVSQIEVSSMATDEGSVAGLIDFDYENDLQDDDNFLCVNNISLDDQTITVTLPSDQTAVQLQLRERWAAKWMNPGWTYDWAPRQTSFEVSSDGQDWESLVEKDVNFNTTFHKNGTFVNIDLERSTAFKYVRLVFRANPEKNIVQLGELHIYPLVSTGITTDTANPLLTDVSQIEVSSMATDEGSVAGLIDFDYENDLQDDDNFLCVNNISLDDQTITVTLPSDQTAVQLQLRERWAAKWMNPGWTYDWAPRQTSFEVSSDGQDWESLVEKDVNFNTEFHKDGTFVNIDLERSTTFKYVRLVFRANPQKNIVQLGELHIYPLVSTGIQDITVEEKTNGRIYDLQGREVKEVTHGIFIQNGKKVFKR